MKSLTVTNKTTGAKKSFKSVKTALLYHPSCPLTKPSAERFAKWFNETFTSCTCEVISSPEKVNPIVERVVNGKSEKAVPFFDDIRTLSAETTPDKVVEVSNDNVAKVARELAEILTGAKAGDVSQALKYTDKSVNALRDLMNESLQDLALRSAEMISGLNKSFVDNSNENFRLFDAKVEELEGKISQVQVVETVVKLEAPNKKPVTIKGEHKQFGALLAAVSCDEPVFLVGAPAGGKTHAAASVAKALDLPYYDTSVSLQTPVSHLVGYMNATGDYVSTAFRQAYEGGGVFLLDEIDNGNPNTLAVLNAALSNGHMSFPDKLVAKHENFRCIAAGNTYGKGADRQFVGRNQLDDATLDRFVFITWDYDPKIESFLAAGNTDWLKKVKAYREAAEALRMRIVISPRATKNGAKLLAAGLPEAEVLEMTIFKGMSDSDRKKLNDKVGGQVSNIHEAA